MLCCAYLFSRDSIHMLNFDPNEFPSLNPNSAPNPSLSARPNYGKELDLFISYVFIDVVPLNPLPQKNKQLSLICKNK